MHSQEEILAELGLNSRFEQDEFITDQSFYTASEIAKKDLQAKVLQASTKRKWYSRNQWRLELPKNTTEATYYSSGANKSLFRL